VRQEHRFVVLGYVVMPEHFHLLMSEPQLGDPSSAMQSVKQRFAQRVVPRRRRRLPALGAERSVCSAANTRPLQKTQGAGHPANEWGTRPAPSVYGSEITVTELLLELAT